jgi:hypothetical protein
MATTVIEFKRGTSFGAACTYTQDGETAPPDLDGVGITSSIRDSAHKLYNLTVAVTSPTEFSLTYTGDSSDWWLGTAYWDIRFAYGEGSGSVFYTQTLILNVIPNVTPNV